MTHELAVTSETVKHEPSLGHLADVQSDNDLDGMPKAKRVDENHPVVRALRWIVANKPDELGRPNMRDVSRKADLAPGHVEQILNGRQSADIQRNTALKLAKAHNVRLSWLMTGAGPREPFDEADARKTGVFPPIEMHTDVTGEHRDPYPERARALRWMEPKLDLRARADLLDITLDADEHWTAEQWVAKGLEFHEKILEVDRGFDAIEKKFDLPEVEAPPAPSSSRSTPVADEMHKTGTRRLALAPRVAKRLTAQGTFSRPAAHYSSSVSPTALCR